MTDRLDLDPALRAALRARHVAFVRERLRGERGKAALRKNLEAGLRAVLSRPVASLVSVDAIDRLVEHLTSDDVVAHTARPLVRTGLLLELARLREEPAPLGDYVSIEARAHVERLLERPRLVPEKLVRELVTHRAFEGVMRDVLDGALREFGAKMNPFTAEWGLPSLSKKGGAFGLGLGAFVKSFESVQGEFERRLEPERKRFLAAFARTALGTVADFVVKGADDPPMIELRKELFAWILEQPTSELVEAWTQKNVELAEEAGHAIVRHVLGMEGTKRRRRAQIELLLGAHGKQTLGEALAAYGARIEPDYAAWVEALWPAVEVALDDPAIVAWLDDTVGAFWDEV